MNAQIDSYFVESPVKSSREDMEFGLAIIPSSKVEDFEAELRNSGTSWSSLPFERGFSKILLNRKKIQP